MTSEAYALVNTVGRIGAKVRATDSVMTALRAEGLVSEHGNLTRKGVMARAEIFEKMTEVQL